MVVIGVVKAVRQTVGQLPTVNIFDDKGQHNWPFSNLRQNLIDSRPMQKKTFVCAVLLFSAFTSCKESESNKNSISEIKNGDIILIFENPPENWKLTKSSGSYFHKGKHEIEFHIDQSALSNTWSPNYLKPKDTLILKNVEKYAEVKHKYKGIDVLHYLFFPNDTAVFRYDQKMPTVSIVNRLTRPYDLGFEQLKRRNIIKDSFPNDIKYNSLIFLFVDDLSNFNEKVKENIRAEQKTKAFIELDAEKQLLDSLRRASLLSDFYYNFYKNKNDFGKRIIQLKEEDEELLSSYPKRQNMPYFSSHLDYLEAFTTKKFTSRIELLEFSNMKIPDYRIVYDSIDKCKNFNLKEKEFLSFKYLERIINSFSNQEANLYYNKFKQKFPKSGLTTYITSNYNITGEVSGNLNLLTEDDEKTNLNEVLDANHGRVIYVDFWASWCAPCREEMPASNQLRIKYKNKEVTFIYLALNDKRTNWEKASIKENIWGHGFNYFIENSKSSVFIDSLDLSSIPRYLIYNKQGKLAHKNAPGPSSAVLGNIIDELLLESLLSK